MGSFIRRRSRRCGIRWIHEAFSSAGRSSEDLWRDQRLLVKTQHSWRYLLVKSQITPRVVIWDPSLIDCCEALDWVYGAASRSVRFRA